MVEKANFYRELAILVEAQQDILKTLNTPDDIFKKHESNRLAFYRSSVLYTINAVIASKKWNETQSHEKAEEANTLTVDQLKDRYLEYIKIADKGNEELRKIIRDNKISIMNLEYYKKICWYICFSFQSLGLIFGLVLVILKKP